MRLLFTFLLTIFCGLIFGQNFAYPSIILKGKSFADFVPPGWLILDSAKGDLNKDRLKDAAIVLQHKDSILLIKEPEDSVITQPRILLLLFKENTGYRLAEQNNSFILNHDNPAMDDPYQELKIDRGALQINFHLFYNMGSWYVTNASYTFRYQKGQFILIGADHFSFHRATGDSENYSYNFLTKKRSLIKENENEGTKKMYRKNLNIPSLKTLRSLKQPFEWEVEKDVYL